MSHFVLGAKPGSHSSGWIETKLNGVRSAAVFNFSLTSCVMYRWHTHRRNYVQLTYRNLASSWLCFSYSCCPLLSELRRFLFACLWPQWPPAAPSHRLHLPALPPYVFPFFSPSFFISHSVRSVRPAVVLATGTVWSCVRAGRAVTCCQNPSAPKMAGPPPGCAVTCSAALPLNGWQVPGER